MPHVDEALLVAYADDALPPTEREQVEAHLASCGECRARVEEERALAQRAAAVLGLGALPEDASVPPFAEIVRRSESGAAPVAAAPTRRTRRALPPLAWAAMLIVALGAGWIARVLLVSPDFNAPVERARSDVEETGPERAARAAPTSADEAEDAAGDAAQMQSAAPSAASGSEAAPAPGTPVTQGFEAAAPREEAASDVVPPPAPPVPAPAPPQAPPQAVVTDSAAQLRAVAAPAAPDSAPRRALRSAVSSVAAAEAAQVAKTAPGTGVIAGRVVNAATNQPVAGGQVTVEGTSLGTLTDAAGTFVLRDVPPGAQTLNVAIIGFGRESRRIAVPRDSSVTAEVEVSPTSVALDAVTIAGSASGAGAVAVDAGTAAWQGPSLEAAAARGVRVLGIRRATVDTVWLATADAPWHVRVVQRIDGAAVEIVEWRSLAPEVAGTSGTLSDGRSYLFTRIGDAPVLLRSALPLERLRTLAAQLQRLP